MKEITYNHDNVKENEIDEEVIRVKALIINSKDEIMLGYCDNTYMFPGGHLKEGEKLGEGLKREVLEEVGIEIDSSIEPFEKINYYTRNYRNSNLVRKNIIYYYVVNTDELPNIDNTNLDEYEKQGNYEARFIPLKDVEDVLNKAINDNPINKIIVEEMIQVLKDYKNN